MSGNVNLLQEIADKINAIQTAQNAQAEAVSEARLATIVKDVLSGMNDDDPVVRKFRAPAKSDPSLVGSKYSRWGCSTADIEMLYDIQQSLTGLPRVDGGGTYRGPSEELQRAYKAVSDAVYIPDAEAREIDRQAIDNMFGRLPKDEFRRAFGKDRNKTWAKARATAMDTTESGYGNQIIGAQYVGDIWDAAFAEARIQNLISTFEMTAPTAYLPVAVDMPEPIFVAESTSDVLATAQYATVRTGSNRVQVDAKKMLIHQVWSGEMEEDSIIPLLAFYRMQAARSLAFYGDSVILNGDTATGANTNINLIDGTPGSTKFYLSNNGMRKVGLIDNTTMKTDAAGAVTLALLRNLKQQMLDTTRFVDWGHPNDPTRLIFITDPQTGDRIATLDEVLQSKVELANAAGLLNGQVASILGHPVISTPAMSLTDATGKVSTTGSNNVKGQVVAANLDAYTIGWRRRVRIETERIPASDQTRIVYSYRYGVGRYNPGGNVNTQVHTNVLYDISLA